MCLSSSQFVKILSSRISIQVLPPVCKNDAANRENYNMLYSFKGSGRIFQVETGFVNHEEIEGFLAQPAFMCELWFYFSFSMYPASVLLMNQN